VKYGEIGKMYAVIFRAQVNELDDGYSEMAARMRKLAVDKYGCIEFTAVTEGNREIAVSYWEDQDQIEAWKKDPEHRVAQELGRSKWYASYQVQVVKIIREYEKR
jgi:heme-degrading monooxygenase HmoA